MKEPLMLDIHFKLKDEAKKLGCKWDVENKTWYFPDMDLLTKTLAKKLKKLEQLSEDIWDDESFELEQAMISEGDFHGD